MRTTPNDGGQAFPRSLPCVEMPLDQVLDIIESHKGMSLRDWFAGQNFAAFMNGSQGLGSFTNTQIAEQFRFAAKISFIGADAMLAARKQGGDQ